MSKLNIDLKVGQSIQIGAATITLEKKAGQLARLVIEADPKIKIIVPTRMSASQVDMKD